ncbi:hypothetical protein AX16_006627 [Volvariella volvacea WC 439]|nr:hypothetical protein AX16_006627 [Volvariella volvacea WC 439]
MPKDRFQLLPSDVWLEVASQLGRNDLNRLCTTSRSFLYMFRPALYRKVELRYSNPLTPETCALLARDADLALSVREICFVTDEVVKGGSTWLPLIALRRMAQLRKLKIFNDPFEKEQEKHDFFDIVPIFCKSLCGFELRATKPFKLSLPLAKLESISWDTSSEHISPITFTPSLIQHFYRSIQARLSDSPHHLSPHPPLNIHPRVHRRSSLRRNFFQLSFPSLQHLRIGSTTGRLADHLTRFLINHPSIIDLHLDFPTNDFVSTDLLAALMHTDMIPNLKRLHAHGRNVTTLLQKGVASMQNLEYLTFGYNLNDLNDTLYELEALAALLEQEVVFPNLRHLELAIGDMLLKEPEEIARCLTALGKAAPKVVHLSIPSIPQTMDFEQVVRHSFPTLEFSIISARRF